VTSPSPLSIEYREGSVSIFITLMLALLLASTSRAEELKGSMGAELRLYPSSPKYEGQDDDMLVPSLLFSPSLTKKLSPTSTLTSTLFGRLHSGDSDQSHLDIRELYLQKMIGEWEMRLGAAKEFWGVTESRHLVNIINQADLVEDIDEEEHLGQPMLNFNREIFGNELRLFLLPYFRERTFPGQDGRGRPPLPIATDAPLYESGVGEWHPDLAMRVRRSIGAWDIGLSEFYGTGREPSLRFTPSAPETLQPYYEVIHQQGVDLQYTLSSTLLKLEALYRSGQGDDFAAAVIGVEHTLSNILGADIGLMLEYLYDGRDASAPVTPFNDDIYLGARIALNDVRGSEMIVGVTIDRDNLSSTISLEGGTRINDSWRLEVEGKVFSSEEKSDPLSIVENDDLLQFRVLYHF